MNLNMIYELRERLETAAIAGVGLIQEDFRLKRTVEQMAPLSAASPVFQKIYKLAQSLTAAECNDRSGTLLDVLALVDAVCCTQGTLQTGGEFLPLQEDSCSDGEEHYKGIMRQNIPYSVLAPLKEAFCGTGSGRYAVIREAYAAQPELFDDYRVEYWMVQALGDSYGDLVDMVADWLKAKGSRIVPLLKQDFRRDGKRDMARRIEVMEAVAGNQENAFYRAALTDTEAEAVSKEVKEAAIRALRHSNENLPFLLELVKKEKGRQKELVLYSLSFLDGKGAEDFWRPLMGKNPEKGAAYLIHSRADWAADLVADELIKQIELTEESNAAKSETENMSLLSNLWEACVGKHSAKLYACCEPVYRLIGRKMTIPLIHSLIQDPDPGLCEQIQLLFREHGDDFLECYIVMLLLTEKKEHTYDRLMEYLKPSGFLEKLTGKKKDPEGMVKAFSRVRYDNSNDTYYMEFEAGSPIMEKYRTKRSLPDGLDLRWYPFLMEHPERFADRWIDKWSAYWNRYDTMIARLYRSDVTELQQAYGRYFYEKANRQEPTAAAMQMLKRCGWTDYQGILTNALEKKDTIGSYYILQLIREMPLDSQTAADELDHFIKRNEKKAVKGIAMLEKWRDELRNGGSTETLGMRQQK